MKNLICCFTILLAIPLGAMAQTFSSGSTGADGALNVTSSTEIQLPPSGVLNYTTIMVASSATLTFKSNYANTPAILLAQGAVNIAGTIKVDGSLGSQTTQNGGVPGPGGFFGGGNGRNGFGPGGGSAVSSACMSADGKWVGPLSLVPIIGGSGGGDCSSSLLRGGGGGGALLIASSSSITVTGSIAASGGGGGSYGSGGAIRLIANSILPALHSRREGASRTAFTMVSFVWKLPRNR